MDNRRDWRKRRGFSMVFVAILGVSGWLFLDRALADEEVFGTATEKIIEIVDDGSYSSSLISGARTVGEVLKDVGLVVGEDDVVFPDRETPLESGMRIHIDRAKTVILSVGGEEREVITRTNDARGLLAEQGVVLSEDDFVLPASDEMLVDEMKIEVVRVVVAEEKEYEAISFKTVESEDNELGWRERKVVTKGQNGEKELVYKVVYHNGKEIKRTLVEARVTKDPVTEEVVQGTYVKLGKKHTGYGTWYAHTGTMSAASPWLPMGSYAKVTNEANGKSVIVKINDRGPFGENRIIDLDKVAFQEIASLGAGVIEVKVEEIKN